MNDSHLVVVDSTDDRLTSALATELRDSCSVLGARNGDDLGRILTSGHDVAILVAHLNGAAALGWRRLALIREELPALPIFVYLEPEAKGWDMRLGECPASQVVRGPADERELSRLVRLAGQLPAPVSSGDENATVQPWSTNALAIIGVAGGVGVTSLATAIAGTLGTQRSPVVVADLDHRHGTLTASLNPSARYTVNDLQDALTEPERLDESIAACLLPVREGLSLLPAPEFETLASEDSSLRSLFRSLRRSVPSFVADLGDLDPRVYGMLCDASGVIVVATPNPSTLRRLPRVIDRLASVAPTVPVRTVLNGVEHDSEPTPTQLQKAAHLRFDAVLPMVDGIRKHGGDPSGASLADPHLRLGRKFETQLAGLLGIPVPGHGSGRRRLRAAAVASGGAVHE